MNTNVHFLLLAEFLLDCEMFKVISNYCKGECFLSPPEHPIGHTKPPV